MMSREVSQMEENLIAAWKVAQVDLGFTIRFSNEYQIAEKLIRYFAYLPEYGSKAGIYLGLYQKGADSLNSELALWCELHSQRCTFINPASYSVYRRQFFIDTLLDWVFFGDVLPPWTDKAYVPWS